MRTVFSGSSMKWKAEATLALTLHYGQHETLDREVGGEYEGSVTTCIASTTSTWMDVHAGGELPRGHGFRV